MKRKTEKSYIFEGLGFPIHLTNVPMIEVRGEYILDIDFNKLQKSVLLHLCHKKTPLTGDEVRFIRKYFSLTTTAFADLFGHTHSAVLKWENQDSDIARMNPSTEICLRLEILRFLHQEPSDFKDLFDQVTIPLLAQYSKAKQACEHIPFSINAKKELMSAA